MKTIRMLTANLIMTAAVCLALTMASALFPTDVYAQQGGGGGGSGLPAPTGNGQCFVSTGSGVGHWTWGSCSGSSNLAFSAITTGTNNAATTTYGTGSTLNVSGSGNIDLSATSPSRLKLPLAAGAVTTTNGNLAFDTTALNWHIWGNAVDNLLLISPASGTFTNGDCLKVSNAAGVITAIDSGGACLTVAGNVSNVGTPLANQLAQWTDATHIQGLATTGSGNAVLATGPTVTSATVGTGLTLSFITGSTQCLHVNSSGVVTGTTQDCNVSIPLGTSAQIPVMNAGATAYAPVTMSQDCTLTTAGVITCLKTNNVSFGTFATQNYATPPAIGGGTPAAGSFTTLSATSTVSGAGITSLFASPPAIGGTAPAGGAFTTLSASSTVSGTGFSTYLASPPAIGGTVPAAGTFAGLSIPSGNVLNWNSDTGFSRDAAATIDLGNGTQGDKSGTLYLATLNASASLNLGAGASAVIGTASTAQGFACGTGTMAGTTGYAGLRCDSATGKWVMILPSGAEYYPPIDAAIVPQAAGGTGIANTATLTLGSANVNWATQTSGVDYVTTTTGAHTPATPHQIIAPTVCNDTSSSATTFTCTTSPTIAALTKGDAFKFCSINQSNSGASTLAIDGLSAVAIKKWQTAALVSGDLQANACVWLSYDGTNLELDTIGNAPGGTGTVTVVGAGSLGNNGIVTGGGTTTVQTICATCTLDASGNLVVASGGSLGSADTGTPKFTFATNKATFNQPLYLGTTSNQLVTGTSTNLTTLTFPAPSGAITLTFPLTTNYMIGANSDTTTTHVLHATAVAGVGNFAAIAAGDLPGGAGQILAGSTPALTATPALGTDNSVAGTLQLANGSANAHTIWGSGATTSNTINGFATAPTTGHLIDCTVTSTTCLLHDSGVVTANVVNASSPGVGIAHFAGSTQTVTSSLIVAADITSSTITGTQIASSIALAGSPTTTSQSQGDNSTKIATTAYVDGQNIIVTTGLTAGHAYYVSAANTLSEAGGGISATAPAACVAISTTQCIVRGTYTTTGLTAGAVYYVPTASGLVTTTEPSSTGQYVQRVGIALSTTVLMVNISYDVGTIQ